VRTRENPTPVDLPRLKREVADIEGQLAKGGAPEWRTKAEAALRVKRGQVHDLEERVRSVYPRGDFDALLEAYRVVKRLQREVDLDPEEVQSIARIERHLKARSVP
jgi:hypothetical protein